MADGTEPAPVRKPRAKKGDGKSIESGAAGDGAAGAESSRGAGEATELDPEIGWSIEKAARSVGRGRGTREKGGRAPRGRGEKGTRGRGRGRGRGAEAADGVAELEGGEGEVAEGGAAGTEAPAARRVSDLAGDGWLLMAGSFGRAGDALMQNCRRARRASSETRSIRPICGTVSCAIAGAVRLADVHPLVNDIAPCQLFTCSFPVEERRVASMSNDSACEVVRLHQALIFPRQPLERWRVHFVVVVPFRVYFVVALPFPPYCGQRASFGHQIS